MESRQKKEIPSGEIVRQGYLKKLKTMKKKYFVLKSETSQNSARLEYYDSEKKFKCQGQPKKVIPLKSCFNITRRLDTRHKHVIALYTKEECLCVVLESEEDLAGWLQALKSPLDGDGGVDDQPHSRQHVWQVSVQHRGLGASRNIAGSYNLCLTDKKLSLVRIRPNNNMHLEMRFSDTLEFPLSTIRRCGDSERFFYMEVGRSSVTGAGELWMHTEDPNIAQSMHSTILNAMSSRASVKEELGPKTRNRSSSANEASKPISVLTRRQTHTGSKSHGLSPSSESTFCGGRSCVGLCISRCVTASAAYCASQETETNLKDHTKLKQEETDNNVVDNAVGSNSSMIGVRERCDSLPSRGNTVVSVPRTNVPLGATRYASALRPHSMFVYGIGQSPPIVTNSPLSPNSGACSTDSAGSSMSIDEPDNLFHHSTTPDEMSHLVEIIPEEVGDETLGIWQPEKNDTINEEKDETICNPKDLFAKKSQTIDCFDSSSPVPIVSTPSLSGDYMPMSPANVEPHKIVPSISNMFPANHSRTSSVTEVTNLTDGQLVPPVGVAEDGYVDMEPSKPITTAESHTMSPTGSFCSITSSTPSNDMGFSEFHLEKVSSYFPPNEDKENRPARAYSVGSRPDHITKIINRPDMLSGGTSSTDAARARAFSVGSRSKVQKEGRIFNHSTPPHCHLHHINSSSQSGYKSSSAPLLANVSYINNSSRYLYNSNHSSAEPLDMMEMDFSNRTTSSSSVKTNYTPPDVKSHVNTSKMPVNMVMSKSSIQSSNKNVNEGYMDMSPVNASKSGYVEMKPAEPSCSSSNSSSKTPKEISDNIRKISLSKSPPTNITSLCKQNSNASEGYVEMTWNSSKPTPGKAYNHIRVSSLPITINSSGNVKDVGSNPAASSSTSPVSNTLSHGTDKTEEEIFEQVFKGNSPKISPGVSPITPVNPSPYSSLRRHSKKHQLRRNSKELSTPSTTQSPIYTFNPTSPMSPIKPIHSNSPDVNELVSDKCNSTDPSCSNFKLSSKNEHELYLSKVLNDCGIKDENISEYMDMNPRGLTTVKEINETNLNKLGVDKDIKQLINNATKVLDSNVASADLSEYINLNPSATIQSKINFLKRQKSVDDAMCNSICMDSSVSKSRLLQNSQPITAPKTQNVFRKVSGPGLSGYMKSMDANLKETQNILSSNPLANKTLYSPLTKSNVSISNISQVPCVRKPILVTITGQTQPITANFKPIPSSEICEARSTKSSSPKPVESVLNRQLASALCDNKNTKTDSSGSKNDGYEMLVAQNGKHTQSRPNSVNKCKKGNGSSSSRPPSVTSQGELSGGNNGSRSRPSSVSSELSSTPTNSRPASVTGEKEGTSSHGLHYVSLELDNADRSPRPPPTPVANRQVFSYVQIDFVKSEELKNSKNLSTKTKN